MSTTTVKFNQQGIRNSEDDKIRSEIDQGTDDAGGPRLKFDQKIIEAN